MEQEIMKIIEQNLPKAIGETLQKRLAELEQKEKNFDVINNMYLTAEGERIRFQTLLQKAGDIDKREAAIKKLEEEWYKKEKDVEVKEWKLKAEESEKRVALATDLVRTVFKNPSFKTTEQHFGSMPVSNGPNCYSSQAPFNQTVEKRTEQED